MIFGKKIKKNNNLRNEFLGINTHENMTFIKKNFFRKLHYSKKKKFKKKFFSKI